VELTLCGPFLIAWSNLAADWESSRYGLGSKMLDRPENGQSLASKSSRRALASTSLARSTRSRARPGDSWPDRAKRRYCTSCACTLIKALRLSDMRPSISWPAIRENDESAQRRRRHTLGPSVLPLDRRLTSSRPAMKTSGATKDTKTNSASQGWRSSQASRSPMRIHMQPSGAPKPAQTAARMFRTWMACRLSIECMRTRVRSDETLSFQR
jgi:hypothetical protein